MIHTKYIVFLIFLLSFGIVDTHEEWKIVKETLVSKDFSCDEAENPDCEDLKLKQILLEDKLKLKHTMTDEQIEEMIEKDKKGDLTIKEDQSDQQEKKSRHKRKTVVSKAKRWPKKTVLYVIDEKDMSEQQKICKICSAHVKAIQKAVDLWRANTCVKFVPKGKTDKRHHLLFTIWDKLHSETALGYSINFFGYKGYQDIKLPKNILSVSVGLIAHEIGHSLGFVHEQTRTDRDEYVTINQNNIISGNAREFLKLTTTQFGGTTNYGLPYDHGSVMHYRDNVFRKYCWFSFVRYDIQRLAKDPMLPTIESKDPLYSPTLGSSTEPTFLDYLQINIAYECSDSQQAELQCLNGGVTDLIECSKCKCPSGFGGNLCETVESSEFGGELEATPIWQQIKLQMEKNVSIDGRERNVWLIKTSTVSKKVELRIDYLRHGLVQQDRPFCHLDYLEIKTGKYDWRTTGYRFCVSSHRQVLRSSGNKLIIMANIELYAVEFVLHFREVSANTPIHQLPSEQTLCPKSSVYLAPGIQELMSDLWYFQQIMEYILKYQSKCGGYFAQVHFMGDRSGISVMMKGCTCPNI